MPFLTFALPLRKIRESCHFRVLLPTEKKIQVKMPFLSLASYTEENSGKNAISKFCFYSEEKSGKNAIQCFASYSKENSGKNAISDFCFLLRRKFRGKCHFKVLLLQ